MDNAKYSHNNPKHVDVSEIDGYTFEDYGLTIDSIKANHFGISVEDPRTGEPLPDAFYQSMIEVAVATLEKELDIVILPRLVQEHHDLYSNDFQSNMYLRLFHKPVLQLEEARLEYGPMQFFNYPTQWWRVYTRNGQIEMLPSLMMSSNGLSLTNAYAGYPMITGMPFGGGTSDTGLSQMIHVEYVAGMMPQKRPGVNQDFELHPDLKRLVVNLALIEVFKQWGRLIIGPGIANMQMDFDGIRQGIDTTQSAMYGGASAEILQINQDSQKLLANLKSYYGIHLGLI